MIAGGVSIPVVVSADEADAPLTAVPELSAAPIEPTVASGVTQAGAAPGAGAPQPATTVESTPEPSPTPNPEERDRASRQSERPDPVVGIPAPCEVDAAFPDDAGLSDVKAAMEERWGLELLGEGWTTSSYRPVVKVLWQTLDAMDCTPYLDDIRSKVGGPIPINAGQLRGYAWGDWGLTRPGVMSLDFAKMSSGYDTGEITRIARVFVHELAHVHSVDRGGSDGYWGAFRNVYNQQGSIADYDHGRDISETYAEAVAHYVVRCSDDNPYATPGNGAYYDMVREHVFGGREFGPTSGAPATC